MYEILSLKKEKAPMNLYYKFENSDAEIKATSSVEIFKEPQLKVYST